VLTRYSFFGAHFRVQVGQVVNLPHHGLDRNAPVPLATSREWADERVLPGQIVATLEAGCRTTWWPRPNTLPDRVALASGRRLHDYSSISDVDAPALLMHGAMVPPAQADQVVGLGRPAWSPRLSEPVAHCEWPRSLSVITLA
jgi:hypothetical protein